MERMETGEETPVRVEETRRRVEKLVVEDSRQASGLFRSMADKAKDGWGKMRKILEGKKLVWKGSTGKLVVVDRERETGDNGGEVSLEEEMVGGTVEVLGEEVERGRETEETGEENNKDITGGWANLDILDKIEKEEIDRDLDERVGEGRKRKRGEEENKERKGGLGGLPGWERRSRNVRMSDRWKRKVMRMDVNEDGNMVRNEADENIPVPEALTWAEKRKGSR
jgi:hypothetical protein